MEKLPKINDFYEKLRKSSFGRFFLSVVNIFFLCLSVAPKELFYYDFGLKSFKIRVVLVKTFVFRRKVNFAYFYKISAKFGVSPKFKFIFMCDNFVLIFDFPHFWRFLLILR